MNSNSPVSPPSTGQASFKFQVSTNSPEETQIIGRKIGELIKSATIIALTGDLGAGKTVFVQGLAKGISVPDGYYITSPSYTLINEYPGRIPLCHVDLYRIGDKDDIEDIGLWDILNGDNVVAIEWADRMKDNLPFEHVAIDFEFNDTDSRKLTLTSYGHNGANLLKKLQKCVK